ncbi:GH36 C-terminal domain-containing protein [Thermophilibacter provencensis]|uniref:GH36 C-terminal domain-containing protein n=1 Tax=Thermophilibacter provencensis TaxID=1852386 RepID=UPI003AA8A182
MKEHRALIQLGDQYRLRSPFEGDGNECAWMVVSAEKDEAIVAYYRILQQINVGRRALRLAGLDPDARYEVREEGAPAAPGVMGLRYRRPLTGSELMRVGLGPTFFSPACDASQPEPNACLGVSPRHASRRLSRNRRTAREGVAVRFHTTSMIETAGG